MRKTYQLEHIEAVKTLYQQGYSSQEILDVLGLKVSVRQVQRWLQEAGITRSMGDAFRNAVKRGRVTYHTKPDKVKRLTMPRKLRFKILIRDGFRCVLCGADAKTTRIEVDHIDENKNNNVETNLQTLCEECNQGKAYHKP